MSKSAPSNATSSTASSSSALWNATSAPAAKEKVLLAEFFNALIINAYKKDDRDEQWEGWVGWDGNLKKYYAVQTQQYKLKHDCRSRLLGLGGISEPSSGWKRCSEGTHSFSAWETGPRRFTSSQVDEACNTIRKSMDMDSKIQPLGPKPIRSHRHQILCDVACS